jgi:TolA-binding protein
MAEIRCERGSAWYHQQQWDSAWREFEAVAEGRTDVLGARARFMLGEIQFARREYDDAVRTFFKVAYGYGDADAPPAFHSWQAEALFEAARCLEQTERFDSARRLYEELLQQFPDSPKATHARVALKQATTR